jgi:hypothetical protein
MVLIFVSGQLLPHTAALQPSVAKQTCLVCVCEVNDIARQSRYQRRCEADTTTIIKHRAIHDRIAATDDIITGWCDTFGYYTVPDGVDDTDCHAL